MRAATATPPGIKEMHMPKESTSIGFLSKIPIAVLLAIVSVIVFAGKVDSDRKRLNVQVAALESKQETHLEKITTLAEKVKSIDQRLERMETVQDRILDLLLKSRPSHARKE